MLTRLLHCKPILLPGFLCLLLAACSVQSPNVEVEGPPTRQARQSTPTPIPNLRAQAVLDESYGRFIYHLAEEPNLVSPQELQEGANIPPAMMLDMRQPLEVRKNGFIPGAVVIPLRELALKTSILPDFSTPIYAYDGDGRRCAIAKAGLGVFGWEIRCLEGGFEAWVAAGQPVEHGNPPYPEIDPLKPAFPCCGIYEVGPEYDELQKANPNAPNPSLVAAVVDLFRNVPDDYGVVPAEDFETALQRDPGLIVLDVGREPHTAGGADLPGYLHIPFPDLISKRNSWPADPAAEIIVLAGDDHTAGLAQSILWIYGYLNAKTIPGGWQSLAMD